LITVLVFFRHVAFSAAYVIPWDLTSFHLPHLYFIAESLASGKLPLWDSYTYCGRPFQANVQTALFYPPSSFIVGLSHLTDLSYLRKILEWNVILHVWFAGLGAYWLGRKLSLERIPSLFLATAYCLGGYFAVHAQHMGAVAAAAWLPWCWALASVRSVWRLSAALALSFLAGHTPLTVLVYGSTFVFAVIWCGRWPDRLRPIAAGAVSLPLIAVQLLPTIELVSQSIGKYRAEFLKTGGMPWGGFLTLIWPNYYNSFDPPHFRGPIDLTYLYLYSGLLTIMLAASALVLSRRDRTPQIMAILAAAGIFMMLGNRTAAGRGLYAILPERLTNALHPEFAAPIFLLALACLAAVGLQARVASVRVQWLLLGLLAADVILVSSGRPFNAAPFHSEPGVSRTQLGGQTANLATVRRLANQATPPWRIDTIDESMLWVTGAPATQVYAANGNDVLALVRVIMSRTAFSKAERWGSYWPVTHPAAPALAMQNVRYVLSRTRLTERGGLRFVAEIPGGFVYENPLALPRFYLVSRLRHAASMDEAAQLISAPSYKPWSEAVVEQAHDVRLDESPAGRVRIICYEHGLVDLETDATSSQFLVTSEAYYPGWKAWVDGREARLIHTNTGFRGLSVPAGRHTVRMAFQPRLFYGSAAVSVAGWLILALLAWRRRPSAARPQHP